MSVPKTKFGRTNWMTSRLGLGTYQLTPDRRVPKKEAIKLIQKSLELGLTIIDTAPLYGGGQAEALIGEALKGKEEQYKLINKVGRFEVGGYRKVYKEAYKDADMIRSQFDFSLKLLNRNKIDMLLIHESDWELWWNDYDTAKGPVMEVIEELRKEGLIDYFGLSTRDPELTLKLIQTNLFDSILYVHYFNMVWQEAGDTVISLAAQKNMGVSIGAPYRQGLLVNTNNEIIKTLERERRKDIPPGIVERIRQVHKLSKESGISMPELGLRFLLTNPNVDVVFVGPKNVKELEENVLWSQKGPLPKDIYQELLDLRKIKLGTWGNRVY